METVAFFNLKGGVGKTSSAVNIAWMAANQGIPTLLWDLDPQGAASWLLKSKAKSKASPSKMLSGKTPIGEAIKSTDYDQLDIIPADFAFRHWDQLLQKQSEQGRKNLIGDLVAPLSETYSLVILDCPPSFSTLTEQVFDTADELFVPLIPTFLSLRTFEKTRDFFKENKLKPKRLHPFFTMVDRRRSLHRLMLTHPPKALRNGLQTAIPYAAAIERMGDHRAPLLSFDKSSPVAKAYLGLWEEIKHTLSLP